MKLIFISLLLVGVGLAVVTIDSDKKVRRVKRQDPTSDRKTTPTPDRINNPMSNTARLLQDLFTNYDTRVAPVSVDQPVNVSLGYSLLHVQDLTETSVQLNGWFQLNWKDQRLAWDPTDYVINELPAPNKQIWLPDLSLWTFMSADEVSFLSNSGTNTNILINSDSRVKFYPPTSLSIPCVKEGEQIVCTMIIGSWMLDSSVIDLHLKDVNMERTYYQDPEKMNLVSAVAERKEVLWEGNPNAYVSIIYKLTFTSSSSSSEMIDYIFG